MSVSQKFSDFMIQQMQFNETIKWRDVLFRFIDSNESFILKSSNVCFERLKEMEKDNANNSTISFFCNQLQKWSNWNHFSRNDLHDFFNVTAFISNLDADLTEFMKVMSNNKEKQRFSNFHSRHHFSTGKERLNSSNKTLKMSAR